MHLTNGESTEYKVQEPKSRIQAQVSILVSRIEQQGAQEKIMNTASLSEASSRLQLSSCPLRTIYFKAVFIGLMRFYESVSK